MSRPGTAPRSAALLAVVVAVALTACSTERRVDPAPAALVAEKVADELAAEFGQRPVVECVEELPATVGAQVVCDLTTEADRETIYPVTATVTAVDTETGRMAFDVVVADTPSGSEG